MKKKSLVLFIPSIENAGVEKNLYIIANYFAKLSGNKFQKKKIIPRKSCRKIKIR